MAGGSEKSISPREPGWLENVNNGEFPYVVPMSFLCRSYVVRLCSGS